MVASRGKAPVSAAIYGVSDVRKWALAPMDWFDLYADDDSSFINTILFYVLLLSRMGESIIFYFYFLFFMTGSVWTLARGAVSKRERIIGPQPFASEGAITRRKS